MILLKFYNFVEKQSEYFYFYEDMIRQLYRVQPGLAMGSISVISEAIHSGVDVIAAVVAVVGVKQSEQPADTLHAYGHGKFENLSGLVQAFLIFVAAVWIILESIKKLIHPQSMETIGLGVLIMLISSYGLTQ